MLDPATAPSRDGGETPLRRRLKWFVLFALALSFCFGRSLYQLGNYAWHNDFFSYIPLIPVITVYLIGIKRQELPKEPGTSWSWGMVMVLGGCATLIAWQWVLHSGWKPAKDDHLTAMTAAYLFFMVAGCFVFFGRTMLRSIAFPIALLVFMIPMPSPMLDAIDMFFQRTSAMMTCGFLTMARMPVYRTYLTIHMPGYNLVVNKECSGIHSTMVLLITSLLAGHLFLRSRWKRLLLVLVVIPLAIVRNGFRIFVIGELCVRISHDMIESPIHRHGGPIFFALSLIPFFLLLVVLRKSEIHAPKTVTAAGKI